MPASASLDRQGQVTGAKSSLPSSGANSNHRLRRVSAPDSIVCPPVDPLRISSRSRDLSACSRGLLPDRESHAASAPLLIEWVVSGALTVTFDREIRTMHPTGGGERRHSEHGGLVQRFGGHLYGMPDVIGVLIRDSARPEFGHRIHSLFAPRASLTRMAETSGGQMLLTFL